MKMGSEPRVPSLDMEFDEGSLSISLYQDIKDIVERKSRKIVSIRAKRVVMPKFGKPILFEQTMRRGRIDVPIQLVADDDLRLRDKDFILILDTDEE